MPGLVGFVGNLANSEPETLLADMARALKHEDWYQVDLDHGQNFGLGRVSLGISNPEPQPIWNEDETLAIVMEGEIYDYQDLKQRLVARGHHFRVNNDAEFVLHLFEEFGEDFAAYLNGAFVIAIWDRQANELVLANDRFAQHPLYYAQHNKCLLFSSGLRALLVDPTLPRTIDPITIAQMLTFDHALGTRTLLSEIQLLAPASLLSFRNGHFTIRSYWTPEFNKVYQLRSEEACLEGLVHYVRQAVARQAYDAPAGMLLSGGLDSRMVLVFLRNDAANDTLYTFTFGIPGCDDAQLAQEVAKLARTQHYFFELRPDFLLDIAKEGVRLTDGLQSCAHMHALATLRSEASHTRAFYKGFLGGPLMGSHFNLHMWADYDEDTSSRLIFDHFNLLFCQIEQQSLFTSDIQRQVNGAVFDSFKAALSRCKAESVANQVDYYNLFYRQPRFSLKGVELVRSQGIVRTPYCDNDLVEFMLAVPTGLRLDRFLMIKAFARVFPDFAKVPYSGTGFPLISCARDLRLRIDSLIRWHLRRVGLKRVRDRHKRPYVDYDGWMRTALRGWVEETLLSSRALERGYFNPDYIRNLVTEHIAGAKHARKLGMLLTVELWHRQFLD